MTPKRTRRRYTAEFKAEVALAALTERQPLAELAARYQLAPAQITRWKLQLRQQAAQVASVKRLVQKLNEALPNGAPTRLYPAFSGYWSCLFRETFLLVYSSATHSASSKSDEKRADLVQIILAVV